MTFELKISGFKTKQQVEEFIAWYEGQGEQDAAIWFEARVWDSQLDVNFMPTDCLKTYPIKWDGNVANMFLSISGK